MVDKCIHGHRRNRAFDHSGFNVGDQQSGNGAVWKVYDYSFICHGLSICHGNVSHNCQKCRNWLLFNIFQDWKYNCTLCGKRNGKVLSYQGLFQSKFDWIFKNEKEPLYWVFLDSLCIIMKTNHLKICIHASVKYTSFTTKYFYLHICFILLGTSKSTCSCFNIWFNSSCGGDFNTPSSRNEKCQTSGHNRGNKWIIDWHSINAYLPK